VAETYYSPRLLLKHCPAEDMVSRYAAKLGWTPIGVTPADPAALSPREVRWVASPVLRVHYAENDVTAQCYVYVAGEHPALLQALAITMAEDLDAWTLDEPARAFDESADESTLGATLIQLAMGAPQEFDSRAFRRIEQALSHRSEQMRDLAIWATSFASWPEFRRPLTKVANEDESPTLRGKASRMLDSFDAAGVPGGRQNRPAGWRKVCDWMTGWHGPVR
jgi:hypothetical protein